MLTRRLDGNFDMTFGHGLNDYLQAAPAVGQNIRTRLMLILSEWFLDTTVGMPWAQLLGVKPANQALLEASIQQCILNTADVTGITAFSLSVDSAQRKATVSVTVTTIYGTSLALEITST